MNNNKKNPIKKKPEREPIDFSEDEDFFNKIFRNLFNFPNDSLGFDFANMNPEDIKKNIKHFSFRFGSGMDKPEIKMNGEPIEFNPDFLKDIMSKGFPNGFNFGFNPLIPEIDAGDISIEGSNTPIDYESDETGSHKSMRKDQKSDFAVKSVPYETPYAEIEEKDNSAVITIELPDIEEHQIILNYYHKEITITAENDWRKFRTEFKLKFEPNKDKTIIENNNGIYIIKLQK